MVSTPPATKFMPPDPTTASADASTPAMKLSLVAIEKSGLIVTAADGNLTAADVDPTGLNPLQRLLGATWNTNRVLLNLDQASYVDSAAIGWLITSQVAFRNAGGMLVIFNVQPVVRQLLDVLKVGRVIPIADDESAARMLAGGAK